MTDLGTFGGDLGSPNAINQEGRVIGWADTAEKLTPPLAEPGDELYERSSEDDGVLTNLGAAPGAQCSQTAIGTSTY